MYIDTHEQRPLPSPDEPWRPNLRPVVPIAIAIVLLVTSAMVPPLAAYAFILTAGGVLPRTAAGPRPRAHGPADSRPEPRPGGGRRRVSRPPPRCPRPPRRTQPGR